MNVVLWLVLGIAVFSLGRIHARRVGWEKSVSIALELATTALPMVR